MTQKQSATGGINIGVYVKKNKLKREYVASSEVNGKAGDKPSARNNGFWAYLGSAAHPAVKSS